VRMTNKVREFPQPTIGHAAAPTDEPMILFSLGDRRFAVQWIVTELCADPAEVIPIHKKRQRKNGQRSTQT
jgi:hypothetical protein